MYEPKSASLRVGPRQGWISDSINGGYVSWNLTTILIQKPHALGLPDIWTIAHTLGDTGDTQTARDQRIQMTDHRLWNCHLACGVSKNQEP